jgi:hypothetical protein
VRSSSLSVDVTDVVICHVMMMSLSDLISLFTRASSTTCSALAGVVVPMPTFPPGRTVKYDYDPKGQLKPVHLCALNFCSVYKEEV